MRTIAGGLLLMTMACASVPPGEEPPEEVGGGGSCDASGLGDLVGRPASSELGTEAVRRSGARSLRWIQPGDAVTMDYRTDRLNIRLDSRNRVEGFTCG